MLKIKYKIVSLVLFLLLTTTILAGCLNKQKDNEMSEEKNSKRKSGNKVDDNRGLKLF